jgi:hypothetical protein
MAGPGHVSDDSDRSRCGSACLAQIPRLEYAGPAEVFYNTFSYDHWQKKSFSITRFLCLQGLRLRAGLPVLALLGLSTKRAVDSRIFGDNTSALPSHQGYLNIEVLKEFWESYILDHFFARVKESSAWKTMNAGLEVLMPAPIFAILIEPLGKIVSEAAYVEVTVSCHSRSLLSAKLSAGHVSLSFACDKHIVKILLRSVCASQAHQS